MAPDRGARLRTQTHDVVAPEESAASDPDPPTDSQILVRSQAMSSSTTETRSNSAA